MGKGGTERVNHIMAQKLACVVSEKQEDRDDHLPYMECLYNNCVGAATGFPPNDVHLGLLPCFPIEVSNTVTWLELRALNTTS